jgi:alpha-L-fucosidase
MRYARLSMTRVVSPMCLVVCLYFAALVGAAEPPRPYGALPSEAQLLWHDMEFYGFLHFTVNTFTDKEWGYGDEAESVFNPTAFDADQIARVAQQGGMKGLILTAKHHDGFCLWPSKYTEHSVKNSPWKGGKGDVVREVADACQRHGLKFGVYLSPWDRNHKDYGRPDYVTYYRNQLRELLTQYGPIFEVWFDGANGGDGYYGGARERRQIDRTTYYGWSETWALVRQLQPQAIMFSAVGPGTRWVGNESGIAGDPCWATMDVGDNYPDNADRRQLNAGDRKGRQWLPAECDVSIRPGWFYHAAQDAKVRTPENVIKLYYASVGRGANLLLNLPPDRRGLIHENDVATLQALHKYLTATFANDLARRARLTASNTRGGDAQFGPEKLTDGDKTTYWATDDAVTQPEVVLDFGQPITFSVVRLREAIRLGQRIDRFALDAWLNGQWRQFFSAESIGAQRLVRVDPITTTKVRLRIVEAAACPTIAEIGLFQEPAPTTVQR